MAGWINSFLSHCRWFRVFARQQESDDRQIDAIYLIETAKLNGVELEAVLRDFLARIADRPINRITICCHTGRFGLSSTMPVASKTCVRTSVLTSCPKQVGVGQCTCLKGA